MKNILQKMFFKWGIHLFDASLKEYGGFNHWIAKLFKWRIQSLIISIHAEFHFSYSFEDEKTYYDGYHNYIWIGPIRIYFWT